jgi:glycosyltransferase involved in cell wall biosynthesis
MTWSSLCFTAWQDQVICPAIDRVSDLPGGRGRPRPAAQPAGHLCCVGRIDRKKNLTLLVEAFAQACRLSGPGFSDDLVLVGDVAKKSQDADLLPTIERLGLSERVHFTGRIPDADLPAIYSAARLAVSVSLHEGFGLAAVEALACGAPLLAYLAAALQEAVGDAALVLNTLDCPAWAEALARLLSMLICDTAFSKGLLRAQRCKAQCSPNLNIPGSCRPKVREIP